MKTDFEISVKDLFVMKSLQSLDCLNQNLPDFRLFEEFSFFLVLYDFLVEVAVIAVLHDNTFGEFKGIVRRVYHNEFDLSSRNTSLYITTFGCLTEASNLTSFRAFYFSFFYKFSNFTFFKA